MDIEEAANHLASKAYSIFRNYALNDDAEEEIKCEAVLVGLTIFLKYIAEIYNKNLEGLMCCIYEINEALTEK